MVLFYIVKRKEIFMSLNTSYSFFFFVEGGAKQPNKGPGRLTVEVLRSHTIRSAHPARVLNR